MITQEQFYKIENEHDCGYWNVCWEHACPCAITTENKGLQESIYNSLVQESKEVAEEFDNESDEYISEDNDDDFDFDDEYYREVSSAYWEEEEEFKLGIHPTQVIERIEKELSNIEKRYSEITFLNWMENGKVKVSLDNNYFGTFDYMENCFE